MSCCIHGHVQASVLRKWTMLNGFKFMLNGLTRRLHIFSLWWYWPAHVTVTFWVRFDKDNTVGDETKLKLMPDNFVTLFLVFTFEVCLNTNLKSDFMALHHFVLLYNFHPMKVGFLLMRTANKRTHLMAVRSR